MQYESHFVPIYNSTCSNLVVKEALSSLLSLSQVKFSRIFRASMSRITSILLNTYRVTTHDGPNLPSTSNQKSRLRGPCTKMQPLCWCQREVGINVKGLPVHTFKVKFLIQNTRGARSLAMPMHTMNTTHGTDRGPSVSATHASRHGCQMAIARF